MRRGEALQRVQEEIRRAQAEALGRTGERLAAALEQIAELDCRLDGLLVGPRLPSERLVGELEARNRPRGQALELCRALIIQREALGALNHAMVVERYPVPPSLALSGYLETPAISGNWAQEATMAVEGGLG